AVVRQHFSQLRRDRFLWRRPEYDPRFENRAQILDPCGLKRCDHLEPELPIAVKDQVVERGFKSETPPATAAWSKFDEAIQTPPLAQETFVPRNKAEESKCWAAIGLLRAINPADQASSPACQAKRTWSSLAHVMKLNHRHNQRSDSVSDA